MEPRSSKHIAALDGLRGIAVSLVVAFHFFGGLVPFGWCGVDLFFVLSGFLITGILWDSRGSKGYYPRFLMRRTLRIMPLYMATVGGMVLFSLVVRNGGTQEILDTQIWYWTFTKNLYVAWNGWSRGWHVLDHFWSLAIEEQFYLVWPWLVLLLDLRWLMRAALFGAAVSIALRFAYPVYPFSYVFTPSRADGLLMGAWLALALRHYPEWVRRSAWPLIICGLLLVGLGAWLDGSMSFYGANMVQYGYMGYSFLFAGWLARTVSGSHSPQEERLLTGRSLCSIGKYSYGIYVFHHIFYWFLLVGMERVGPLVGDWKERVTLICLLLLLPFTYFAARFSYEHFEKRFLLLKPRFAATAD